MKMCIHQFFGDCPNCIPDFDENSHPNNLDCKNFYAIEVGFFEIKEVKDARNESPPSQDEMSRG
jgi:hypothetical protein